MRSDSLTWRWVLLILQYRPRRIDKPLDDLYSLELQRRRWRWRRYKPINTKKRSETLRAIVPKDVIVVKTDDIEHIDLSVNSTRIHQTKFAVLSAWLDTVNNDVESTTPYHNEVKRYEYLGNLIGLPYSSVENDSRPALVAYTRLYSIHTAVWLYCLCVPYAIR